MKGWVVGFLALVVPAAAVAPLEAQGATRSQFANRLTGDQCGFLTNLDADRADRAIDLIRTSRDPVPAACLDGNVLVESETKVPICRMMKESSALQPERASSGGDLDTCDSIRASKPYGSCRALARSQAELSALANRIVLRRSELLQEIDDAEEKLTTEREGEIECLEALLTEISTYVEAPDTGHLFLGFDDYSDHFYGFHLGFEYATLTDVLGESALPRTGFMVTTRFRGSAPQERIGLGGSYGSQLILQAQLTSSGEENVALEPQDGDDDDGDDDTEDEPSAPATKEPQQSLEFELAWFKPVYSSWATTKEGRRLKHTTGLIVAVGGRKSDEVSEADRRVYGGVRFAMNPELYGDILYGDTHSLRSRRIELRGQLPIFKLSKGSRLYLGAIGNFGIDDERKEKLAEDGTVLREAEPDSIRVYLSFETNVQDLFNF